MMSGLFFDRDDYREYVRLLAQLHRMIAASQDEGSEAERLRERMDACSGRFNDEEIASLNGISGDLYSLTAPVAPPRRKTPGAQHELFQAMLAERSGEYVTALDLLRRNRKMIEPALLSYMRGQIFAGAGLEEIANTFFEHASTLEPTVGSPQS